MLSILRESFSAEAVARQSSPNVMTVKHRSVDVTLVFDEHADRMRLMTPIVPVDQLQEHGQLLQILQANFHTTLDVRYAVSQDMVWAAFLHPLSTLHESLLKSAVDQVASSKLNFGTSYSAGSWVFGGGRFATATTREEEDDTASESDSEEDEPGKSSYTEDHM